MNSRILFVTLATSLATMLATPANANNPSPLTDESQKFVTEAAQSTMFEIRSSEVALERSQNKDVRDFAQKMINDHSKAKADMTSLLQVTKAESALPQVLDEAYQEKVKDLQEADLEDFDQDYISVQVDAHDKALSLFKDYAEDGENSNLRQFAAQTLPTLQQHDKHVEELDKAID